MMEEKKGKLDYTILYGQINYTMCVESSYPGFCKRKTFPLNSLH